MVARSRLSEAEGLGFVPADHIWPGSVCTGVCQMSFGPSDPEGGTRTADGEDGRVEIEQPLARALGVAVGDVVRHVRF